jgi:hypothetical protein
MDSSSRVPVWQEKGQVRPPVQKKKKKKASIPLKFSLNKEKVRTEISLCSCSFICCSQA